MTNTIFESRLNEKFLNRVIRTHGLYLLCAALFIIGIYLTANHGQFTQHFIILGILVIITDTIRRVLFVRIAPKLIKIDQSGVYIEYFIGDALISRKITWGSLIIEKDYAFTRENLFILILKFPESQIKIYANSTSELNNVELKELFNKLKQFQVAYH